MIDRIGVGNADAMRVCGTNPFALTAIAIAGTMLLLAVGCAVLGDPNPCDRTQAVRDALEKATGRDCDLITDDDLADVWTLTISGRDNLKGRDLAGLDNLRSLTLRTLRGNELPWGVISGFDSLQTLDLSHNNLSELPPGVFDELVNLQTLDLSHNNLSELPPGLFDNLNNLSELYLHGNPGDPFNIQIGVCGRTPAVRAILEQGTGQNCAGITDVILGNLQTLQLVGNNYELYSRDLPPGAFGGLDNLQGLYLWNNNLSKLPPGVFDGLDNLEWLDWSDNNLSELHPGVFDGLDNLQSLDLGDNNLSELHPGVFDGLDNLQRLVLWNNNLSELPPGVFDGLDNLQELHLNGNNMSELHLGIFDSLDNLQELDLSGNPGAPFRITHPNPNLSGTWLGNPGWER